MSTLIVGRSTRGRAWRIRTRDPVDELAWDQRALDAAGALTDERAQRYHSSLAVDGFLPSLHLNLAEDHRKVGDLARAREHVGLAQRRSSVLPDDPYGTMVRQAIARVADGLGVIPPPPLYDEHQPKDEDDE